MRIIKKGSLPEAKCSVCGTEFEYDRSCTTNFYRKKFFGLIKRQVTFAYCPCCSFPVNQTSKKFITPTYAHKHKSLCF